jgi:hypothetical protein
MENWENYPIIFITPNGNAWDPNTSHFAQNEAAMLDSNGLIIELGTWLPRVLFIEADLEKLYGKPVMWDEFNDAIDSVYTSDTFSPGCPLTEDEVVKLDTQGIFANLASLGINCEPTLFALSVTEHAHLSHAAMALGSMTMYDTSCENF